MRQRRKLAIWLVEILYGEDMLWDYDDSEQCIYSIEEWAADHWDWEGLTDSTITRKFQRALGLPAKTYSITRKTYQDRDDVDFVAIEVRP